MCRSLTLMLAVFFISGPIAADPIHDAVKADDIARVTVLLDEGVNVNTKGANDEAPLIVASLAGHLDVVELLLSRGAEVNTKNQGGVTALHAAAYAGHLEIVQRLIGEGNGHQWAAKSLRYHTTACGIGGKSYRTSCVISSKMVPKSIDWKRVVPTLRSPVPVIGIIGR